MVPTKDSTSWRQTASFPRSVRHQDAESRPEVIGFFDGSDSAFCGVVYLRWLLKDGHTWYSTLVTSKAKVTPGQGTTTPRSELSGLVVLVRLMDNVIKAMSTPPVRCSIMGDSTCVIAACDVNANALQPYFSNRVVEIVNTMRHWGSPAEISPSDELQYEQACSEDAACIVDTLQHIPGIRNIADIPTRGNVDLQDIDLGSAWQNGPGFLSQSRDQWPISNDFVRQVPESECRKKFLLTAMAMVKDMSSHKVKDIMAVMENHNSITFVRHVLARLVRASRL